MTRYRLPEALGGGEFEAARDLPGASVVWFKVPGGTLELRREVLTPVDGPALPPEPPIGSVILVDFDGLDSGLVLRRYESGWASPGADYDEFQSWAGACRHGIPVLLVPDPFAGPVELPWKSDDTAQAVGVSAGDLERNGLVYVETEDYTLCVPRRHVRAMARALWAAVDGEKATP